MAKNLKRVISMVIALVLCFGMIATPAFARDNHQSSTATEWYQVIVNGSTAAYASGNPGDHTWLVQGVYSWDVSVSGTTLHWRAGKHSGSVNLTNYVTIPAGFEVAENGYSVSHTSVEGTNSQSANFDNAIITVTIETLVNKQTGEEVDVNKATNVTVNHNYYTYDVFRQEEVLDGSATSSSGAVAGDSYTAVAIPSYNGVDYTRLTDDSKLTITLVEDASANVINIKYLRTIDTTPAATQVTVNHIYKTYDVYTGEIVEDGRTSTSEDKLEREVYTATAAPSYNGNTYAQQTDDSALTITLVADAAANVINIEYLRTIDTTPAATQVTVNHIYKTYDVYTGEIVEDGRTSTTEDTVERKVYTAIAVPSYKGSHYVQQTANSALTITTVVDAAANVINIEYLREIDTTPVDYAPMLHLVKTADKTVYKAGETITWTITVQNISAYTAYDVVISDDLTGDNWAVASLAPGAKVSFTATLENAPAGLITNVAEASWTDNDEVPDKDEPQEPKNTQDEEIVEVKPPVNYTPLLNITKTAGKAVYEAGETITWTITVQNISDYTAYNVSILDELTGDSWTIEALAPGAEQTFHTSLADAQPGSVKNVVVATWEDGDEIPDEEEQNEVKTTSDEAIVGVNDPLPENYTPIITVNKTAGKAVYEAGETITWTITVKNVSDYTAYNVSILDELTGDSWTIEALEAGAEKSYTTSLADAQPGTIKNVVVVNWNDGDEIPDEEEQNEITTTSDEEVVEVAEPEDPAPVLRIVKTSSKYLFATGETVTWYISVENISEYTAYNVVISDNLTGDVWKIAALEPGASRTFAATTETTAPGYITNVAIVNWTDGDDIPDAEETDEVKTGSDDAIVMIQDPTEITPQDDDVIIEDESVPLASAPRTGDISSLLAVISLASLGGMILLNRKKDEE